MVNENAVLLMMERPCDEAVEGLAGRIRQSGFTVVRTFNLQETRQAHCAIVCPQHGRQGCDCQVVVLLIYDRQVEPITLLAYGYGQQTWLSVINNPQQHADPQFEAAILTLLSAFIPGVNSGKLPLATDWREESCDDQRICNQTR